MPSHYSLCERSLQNIFFQFSLSSAFTVYDCISLCLNSYDYDWTVSPTYWIPLFHLISFRVSFLCLLTLPLSHFQALTTFPKAYFSAVFHVFLGFFILPWFCMERKVFYLFRLQSVIWHKNSSIQRMFLTQIYSALVYWRTEQIGHKNNLGLIQCTY
jgi:hypothetical protein